MKIGNALKDLKKPCISFEFFPPSDDSELPAFYDVAEKLAGASPLFASVTMVPVAASRDARSVLRRLSPAWGLPL